MYYKSLISFSFTLSVYGHAKKSVRIVYAFIYSTDFLEVITWVKILFNKFGENSKIHWNNLTSCWRQQESIRVATLLKSLLRNNDVFSAVLFITCTFLNTHNQQVIEEIPMVDEDEKLKETILTSGQRLKGSKQCLHPWRKSRFWGFWQFYQKPKWRQTINWICPFNWFSNPQHYVERQ